MSTKITHGVNQCLDAHYDKIMKFPSTICLKNVCNDSSLKTNVYAIISLLKNIHHFYIENYSITLELDDPTAFAFVRIGECYEKLEDFSVNLLLIM